MAKQNNLARALENYEQQQLQPGKRPQIKKLEKSGAAAVPKQKGHLLKSLLCIAYILGLCGVLIMARVYLAEQNNQLIAAQKEYQEADSDYTQLSLKAEEKYNLKEIDRIAREEHGMVNPDQSQINYIQVEKDNKIEISQNENDWMTKISRLLGQIKEYIGG